MTKQGRNCLEKNKRDCDSSLSIVTTSDPAAGQWRNLVQRTQALELPAGWRRELILVDDLKQWSNERQARTEIASIAPDLPVRVLWYPERRGQLAAVMSGIGVARGEAVMTLDPDIAPALDEVPAMLDKLAAGCLIVHGYRPERAGLPLARRLGSRVANFTVRVLTGIRVPDIGSPVVLFSMHALTGLPAIPATIRNTRLFAYRCHADRLCAHALPGTEYQQGLSHYSTPELFMLYLELLGQCLKIRHALPRRDK